MITFGLVGIGSFGRGIFHQSRQTPGVRCAAVCDLHRDRALSIGGTLTPPRWVDSESQLAESIARGQLAACEDAVQIAGAPGIDVYVDASTALDAAIPAVEKAISTGKHVVMMNAEADAAFGPWFHQLACRNGVVYSSGDGDQPAVIARLVEEIRFYGLDFVMAGNIKGFLDRYSNPELIKPEAAKRGLEPQMCASYTDGTKLCIEMSLVANGLGCAVSAPGMLGPRMADVLELFAHFDLAGTWTPGRPLVDYVLGARPKGGVFVVGHTADPYQRKMLDWFPSEHGTGPFYVFTRPYHLVHFEAMRTLFDVTAGRAVLAPGFGMRTGVVAHAKKPLREGSRLDGPGGFASYGLIENLDDHGRTGFPSILSHGALLKRSLAKDRRIGWDDIEAGSIPPRALATYRKSLEAPPMASLPGHPPEISSLLPAGATRVT